VDRRADGNQDAPANKGPLKPLNQTNFEHTLGVYLLIDADINSNLSLVLNDVCLSKDCPNNMLMDMTPPTQFR
jgi:hypothetical protein